MAARNARKAFRLFVTAAEGPTSAATGGREFDEAEIWGYEAGARAASAAAEFGKPASARSSRTEKNNGERGSAAASLPVNVPDWAKILKEEYKGSGYDGREWAAEDWIEDDDATCGVIPPHEYLWRNRASSFSVHEGSGRTLKGRDLSRVRNAVWEKTGFQD